MKTSRQQSLLLECKNVISVNGYLEVLGFGFGFSFFFMVIIIIIINENDCSLAILFGNCKWVL